MRQFFFLFSLLLFLLPPLQAQTFKAGAALRVITPKKLLPISGGMGKPQAAKGFQGDLYVRALVFEKGTTRLAIVSIDNLGWPAYLGDRSRQLIQGIAPEHVLIGVTHTHSAPDAYAFPDENGQSSADLDYLNWCVQQVAAAVQEAIQELEPASLKVAVGEAHGQIAYNYYAPKLYDPRCGIIQAIATTGEKSGKPIATLINYAIHPEILGPDRQLISPDLCGPLYERIDSKGGGMAIFMNSAQGGMVTADNRRKNGQEANNWEECIRIGHLLADEALRILTPAPLQKNPDLFVTSRTITLPVDSEAMQYVFQHSPLAANTNRTDFSSIDTQVNLLNLGTAQAITIPGEALPNIGYYLKRHLKTKHPFLFGLTNDAFGYILTKEDFNSFERYNYISRTSLGEMTGEIYEQNALQLIQESPPASDF